MKKFIKRNPLICYFAVFFFFYACSIKYFDITILAEDSTIQPSSSIVTPAEQTIAAKAFTYAVIVLGVIVIAGVVYYAYLSPDLIHQPTVTAPIQPTVTAPIQPTVTAPILPVMGQPTTTTVLVQVSRDNIIEVHEHIFEYYQKVDLTRYQAGGCLWTHLSYPY